MDINEISSLIKKAASVVEANEKLALPIVAAKARREAQANPNDVPLVNASSVLTKMASTQTFIAKDELKGILNRFSASHSKLLHVFADELGREEKNRAAVFQRDGESTTLEMDYSRVADPLLSNALSSAFADNPTEAIYTADAAQRAQRAVSAQLLAAGVNADSIETFAGRGDIIICKTTHETPKGKASALIPVELVEGKAKLPQLFFTQNGFQDISKEAYVKHLLATAGKSFHVDGAKLIDVLEQVKKGSDDASVEQVKFAALKIASDTSGGHELGDPNAILYQELEEGQQMVELPKAAVTEESTFAESLGKPDGVARFIHGDRAVEAGRSTLTRAFAEIGYNNVQVKVAEVEEDKVFYAVAVGTGTGFKVPVEIANNRALPPKVLFANESIMPFNKTSIEETIKAQSGGNKKALAVASPCYDMKPTELLDVVKESVAEGNFTRAEEAINVLGEVDPGAQRVAIAHMMIAISNETGNQPEKEFEEMQRIAKTPVYDTPQFMTSKIFFPEGA